jgi:UPF0755 protein
MNRGVKSRLTRSKRHVTISAVWAAGLLTAMMACGAPNESTTARVIIPTGASFRTATDSLVSAGLVGQPRLFRAYARLQRRDRTIQPGVYLIQRGTSWNGILTTLSEANNSANRITIPEGFTIAQITPLLAEHLNVPAESIDMAVRDSALLARLDVPTPTLEGYLFPDTYIFPPGTTARQAIAELVKRFEREWQTVPEEALERLKMNRHQVMTIASIVEKEAKIAEERPVIAGVYHNRLRIGMPLQADPTVQYALGRHVARVTFDDLKTESPYNTYLYPGLPPGPIASPGGASIRAALMPATVPYLYFVAAPDGHHEFRKTHEEHTEAIRSIRGQVAQTQRKSPAKAQ